MSLEAKWNESTTQYLTKVRIQVAGAAGRTSSPSLTPGRPENDNKIMTPSNFMDDIYQTGLITREHLDTTNVKGEGVDTSNYTESARAFYGYYQYGNPRYTQDSKKVTINNYDPLVDSKHFTTINSSSPGVLMQYYP